MRTVLWQLLVLFAYSALFVLLAEMGEQGVIKWQMVTIGLHFATLLLVGLLRFPGRDSRYGTSAYILSAFLILIVGYGLCFFNGASHFTTL